MNVEAVGKTVEEALEAALKELNLTKEEVDYTVLIEPKKGFLGFGKKEAKILVTPKADTISPFIIPYCRKQYSSCSFPSVMCSGTATGFKR